MADLFALGHSSSSPSNEEESENRHQVKVGGGTRNQKIQHWDWEKAPGPEPYLRTHFSIHKRYTLTIAHRWCVQRSSSIHLSPSRHRGPLAPLWCLLPRLPASIPSSLHHGSAEGPEDCPGLPGHYFVRTHPRGRVCASVRGQNQEENPQEKT